MRHRDTCAVPVPEASIGVADSLDLAWFDVFPDEREHFGAPLVRSSSFSHMCSGSSGSSSVWSSSVLPLVPPPLRALLVISDASLEVAIWLRSTEHFRYLLPSQRFDPVLAAFLNDTTGHEHALLI